MRRFYKKTTVEAFEEGYRILLDGRPLKTPAKNPLVLPEALTYAIAAEWDSQLEIIEPSVMPLTSLAATALDQVCDVEHLLSYARTDTTCFLAGEAEEPRLHQLQLTHFLPLLDWLKSQGAELKAGYGIAHKPCVDVTPLRRLLPSNKYQLAALQCATQECKSIVIGLALLNNKITMEEAETAARLEESVQIDRWGFVEGSHDYDVTRIKFRLASASLFASLSPA